MRVQESNVTLASFNFCSAPVRTRESLAMRYNKHTVLHCTRGSLINRSFVCTQGIDYYSHINYNTKSMHVYIYYLDHLCWLMIIIFVRPGTHLLSHKARYTCHDYSLFRGIFLQDDLLESNTVSNHVKKEVSDIDDG